MRYLSWITVVLLAASSQLSAFAHGNKFNGEWVMNIGTANLVQHGNDVTGTIDGYGGFWHQPLVGTAKGKEVSFSTTFLGDFTLALDSHQLKSTSPDLSVCGVDADVTDVIQKGCGFSDKWIVAPSSTYPAGTYMLLTQTAGNVTGNVYNASDVLIDSISGTMYWGKGWRMNGNTDLDPVTFIMNAAETGFEIEFDPGANLQLCAVREGQVSAYLGYFTCQP